MLRLQKHEIPLEALRLGYALKSIAGSRIQEASGRGGVPPLTLDAIASSLGLRNRSYKHECVPPTLDLFGCNLDGSPKAELVHELYIDTRRSGDDSLVGPLVSRWLRLMFHGDEKVFCLPVSAGDAKKDTLAWTFYTLDGAPRAVTVTYNPLKFHRVRSKSEGMMAEATFQWLKSIPGHFWALATPGETPRKAALALSALQRMVSDIPERVIDCLTGTSSIQEDRMPLKSVDMISVLRELHSKLEKPEFSTLGGFVRIGEVNLYDSPLVEAFEAAEVFDAGVQHEILASGDEGLRKLLELQPRDGADFLRMVFKGAAKTEEMSDTLSSIILRKSGEI